MPKPRKSSKKSLSSSFDGPVMLRALRPYWRFQYSSVATRQVGHPFDGLQTVALRKSLIVARGPTACLLLNKYPYAPGHLLAVPYRRFAGIEDATDIEHLELQHWVATAKLLLQKVLRAQGVNIGLNQGPDGVSGGSIPDHMHWHIVPRWRGDHSFMPVIAGTRLLPRSMAMVLAALRQAYRDIPV